MACPPPDLVLFAGTGEPLPDDSAWTVESLDEHVLACGACRREVEAFRRSVQRFSDVDVVDTERFDADFFDELAREVDAAMGVELQRAKVVPLRRRPRTSTWLLATAAGLLLALGLWQLRPEPAAELATDVEPAPEQGLEAEARALGRAWLSAALDEDEAVDQALMAESDPVEDDDLGYAFSGTWMDDLDELHRDELSSLFTRL